MTSIGEWQTLLAIQAGASATLTGLVFVAVSINLVRILGTSGLSGRAGESLFQFLQVFFICTAALIPRQSMTALAIETLVIAGISWIMQAIWQLRYARSRSGHPSLWLNIRILQTQLASMPFFIAGIYMLQGSSIGLYALVPGFLFSFTAGVANAWVLLIEVAR